MKILAKKDVDYEKQLERVLNEYTPVTDPKKKTHVSKYSDKKTPVQPTESKLVKTKYSTHHPNTNNRSFDFKKKATESTRQTTRKIGPQQQAHH